MEDDVNTKLLESAAEVIDEGYLNKYDEAVLIKAIDDGDLEMVQFIVNKRINESYKEEFYDIY